MVATVPATLLWGEMPALVDAVAGVLEEGPLAVALHAGVFEVVAVLVKVGRCQGWCQGAEPLRGGERPICPSL